VKRTIQTLKKAAALARDAILPTRRRVALIAHARTGTHYLRGLLNTHPGVFFYDEILYPSFFDHGFYQRWRQAIETNPDALFVARSIRPIFEDLLRDLTDRRTEPVVGFDLKIPQLEELPRLHHAIIEADFDVIHLTRTNTLRSVISERIMWQRISDGDTVVHRDYTPAAASINIDPAALIAHMHRRLELDERIRTLYAPLGPRYCHLAYESFESEPDAPRTLAPILQHLGLDPAKATFRQDLKRQNPAPLRDLVTNFEDLAAALRNTPFEPQLHT
jgi:hypothetical protein